jgi:hypothetical protein
MAAISIKKKHGFLQKDQLFWLSMNICGRTYFEATHAPRSSKWALFHILVVICLSPAVARSSDISAAEGEASEASGESTGSPILGRDLLRHFPKKINNFGVPSITELIGSEDEIHKWDRYVRRFRRDHNLSVFHSFDQGYWNVGSFGQIQNEDFISRGVSSLIQYTFHIQLVSKFGYYLGSNAGYFVELEQQDDRDFGPASYWILPGLLGGIVYNYDSTGRVFVGGSANLSRILSLKTIDTHKTPQSITVTGEIFELATGWERFVTLNLALKLQYSARRMWVPKPKNAESLPVDAKINYESRTLGLGITYHFL